ncbi:hypothetical protein EVAR_14047_1 [Eumeta japonica]|uniref:Uncharacterized protein n=1 Tax=Eumeta variegata TaxID=151549 RepID=A0A4C1UNE8_EUMVA|nr:hypothetical protein EVAR_14047_1 [Eumeta japonica]
MRRRDIYVVNKCLSIRTQKYNDVGRKRSGEECPEGHEEVEYKREVTAFVVAFRLINKSFDIPLIPLSPPYLVYHTLPPPSAHLPLYQPTCPSISPLAPPLAPSPAHHISFSFPIGRQHIGDLLKFDGGDHLFFGDLYIRLPLAFVPASSTSEPNPDRHATQYFLVTDSAIQIVSETGNRIEIPDRDEPKSRTRPRWHVTLSASVLNPADMGSIRVLFSNSKFDNRERSKETSKERPTSNTVIDVKPPQPAVIEARPYWLRDRGDG